MGATTQHVLTSEALGIAALREETGRGDDEPTASARSERVYRATTTAAGRVSARSLSVVTVVVDVRDVNVCLHTYFTSEGAGRRDGIRSQVRPNVFHKYC